MDKGRIVDVRGDELAHNKGVICVKGSMVRALPYVSGRLLTPKIRRGGRLQEASWDEAMGLAAETFKRGIAESGHDSVAFYGSGPLSTEESYTGNNLAKPGMATHKGPGPPRLPGASPALGNARVRAREGRPASYEDVPHAPFFSLRGATPSESHPPI